MLTSPGGPGLTSRQLWWRNVRPRQIEQKAYGLIMGHERKHGKLDGCVIQPELLLQTVGCDLHYFDDRERAKHQIPGDAIGVLKPYQRLILIYAGIGNRGRENQTVGEEIGHFLLHAKGVPGPGQGVLGFEESTQTCPGPELFFRTEKDRFVDHREEPVWMSREAAFFAACLQMPLDRYGPRAEQRLMESLLRRVGSGGYRLRTVMEKQDLVRLYLDEIRRAGYDPEQYNALLPGVFDTDIVEEALDLLERDHGGVVSRQAQRRRMVELGLVVDAPGILADVPGAPEMPRFEHFVLSDDAVRQARSPELGGCQRADIQEARRSE